MRAFRPPARTLRLRSNFYRTRRHASSSPPNGPQPTLSPSNPPQIQPGFFRRNRIPILLSTLFLIAGLGAGTNLARTVLPASQPAPGTPGDARLLADLRDRIDASFKVKVLRGKCLGVSRQLRGEHADGWVELVDPATISQPVSENTTTTAAEAAPSLVAQQQPALTPESTYFAAQLRGASGTGVERVFWDRGSGAVVAVVWFGAGLAGWPRVTHGGVLATAMAEKMALAEHLARRQRGGGVEDQEGIAAIPQRLPGTGQHARMPLPAVAATEAARQLAEFHLAYRKPTFTDDFYVIRVTPAVGTPAVETEAEGTKGRGRGMRPALAGADWDAVIETMDAKICVLAQAKFASSGSLIGRAEQRVAATAQRSYAEFKSWLWPSRQSSSQIG